VSFEVLRDVAEHNRAAQEEEQDRQAELGTMPANCPAYPLVAWGGQLDTTVGTRRAPS
jgi:hypothetical protein